MTSVIVLLALLLLLGCGEALRLGLRATTLRLTHARTTPLSAVKLTITDETEPMENVLKRFKRAVNQSGHLMELRHRELWETAADKRKRKAERARQLTRIERTNDRFERRSDGASEYNS